MPYIIRVTDTVKPYLRYLLQRVHKTATFSASHQMCSIHCFHVPWWLSLKLLGLRAGLLCKRMQRMNSRTVSVEIMEQICDRLAGGETLVDITNEKNMPSYRSVTRAVQADEIIWEMYRKARILQAEYYADHLNALAMAELPKVEDPRMLNAEVQRRRLEIETLKWTAARNQPFGIRDKKEDQPQAQTFTISWSGGDTAVSGDEEELVH
jgi:hypothetical protein